MIFDKNYDPLKGDILNKTMMQFSDIFQVLNEKKNALIDTYPDKAKELMRHLSNTPMINPGQYVSPEEDWRHCYGES